jgi:DNA-binding GntR family transcriptional regulator
MPPVPDYADERPAYVQIADDLRSKINSGEYVPGSRLPANRVLTDHYGVATVTLRQALEVLRQEKIVATQSTRGTFVLRKPREPTSADSNPALPGAAMERVESLESEMADLRKQVGRLQAQMMDLYHTRGQSYPYKDGSDEVGRQVG